MVYDGKQWYMNSYGYLRNKKYGLLHRYIWTQYNGAIPKGYIVHHKNEDRLDNEISNLKCMTRSEHTTLHKTGIIISSETRAKRRETFERNGCSSETRAKISDANKGDKAHNYIVRTDEMYEQVLILSQKAFMVMFNVCKQTCQKIKKEAKAIDMAS